MEAPQLETNIHKVYADLGVKVVGVEIYNGTPSTINSQFISLTNITFPILTYGNAISQLYGMNSSNFVVVGIDGNIKSILRYYDERAIKRELDSLTRTPGEKPKFQPDVFTLHENVPNPFNPQTRIEYEIVLDAPDAVELAVFDIQGRRVITLVDREQKSGFYEAVWDGRTTRGDVAPSGLYFYRLTVANRQETKTMLLLR